jgi:hypothetical protein
LSRNKRNENGKGRVEEEEEEEEEEIARFLSRKKDRWIIRRRKRR